MAVPHFDAASFMEQTYDDANATNFTPVPEGEYQARIGTEENDVSVAAFQGTKDPTKTYIRLTLMWEIIDEALKAQMDRDTVRVRDQFILDIDESTGGLAFGADKNVALGQRREALGLNDPGQPFSFAMFRGAGPAIIRITQRSDKDNPDRKYNDVKSVTAM
jgi:hypothetical protein